MIDPVDDIPFEDSFDNLDSAFDSASDRQDVMMLPRVLRYALLASRFGACERLAAEIGEVRPDLAEPAVAWAASCDRDEGLAFSDILDGAAVADDCPLLRSFADSVRVLTLSAPFREQDRPAVRRVGATLLATVLGKGTSAWPPDGLSPETRARAEKFAAGWCALSVAPDGVVPSWGLLNGAARQLGETLAEGTAHLAAAEQAPAQKDERQPQEPAAVEEEEPSVPSGTLRVCLASAREVKRGKGRAEIKGHEHILEPLPLVGTPDLHSLRSSLAAEYPYARDAIARFLEPLEGGASFVLPPTVLVGSPGCGKSRLVRRLSELAHVPLWRSDGARSDGGSFAGTDRRWASAEPCHPVLAISRTRVANPAILIDELDKAATRTDYSRLWDALLGFCEQETAARYPDPALQVDVDVSRVSIICTANSIAPLPAPLRDRLRVIHVPDPESHHLDDLARALMAEHAREKQLDERWITPLSGEEREALAAVWRGGSVRMLQRYVAAVLKARDERQLSPN